MPNGLSRWLNVTVVLRLVIDDQAVLSHGEILDPSGNVQQRFTDWSGLLPALTAALKQNEG